MSEVQLHIAEDGTVYVERGTPEQNEMVRQLLTGEIEDPEALERFLHITDNSELLFGDSVLCG